MRSFVICLMMLAMFAATANALTTTVAISTSAADGWAMNDGSLNTIGGTARVGYNAQGWSAVTQVYFTIPAVLKAAGVVINSADLYMETASSGAGSTGYGGTYVQLMQYTHDTGTVSVAQANAIADGVYAVDHPENYTKIGAPVFKPNGWAGYHWDVASLVAADLAAGWTYVPIAAKITRSDGTWYESPYEVYGSGPEASGFFDGYYASFWMYDQTGDPASRLTPKITIDYSIVPEPATMLLLGIGALAGLRRRRA